MFCTFWLQNLLFATAACKFWFLCWAPTSAPAALTGLLFDWPDTRIIEKTQHFATSLAFGGDVSSFFWLSRYCIFFPLTLLLLICFSSAFSTLHIVGSLLFKLPSIICHFSQSFFQIKKLPLGGSQSRLRDGNTKGWSCIRHGTMMTLPKWFVVILTSMIWFPSTPTGTWEQEHLSHQSWTNDRDSK